MKTKLIGIKQFRKDITTLWKDSQKQNIRYIVMYHATPIFEVNPIDQKDITLENLAFDVEEARADIKKGKVYTQEEVYKELGI
ncbi:MAG: hypothetical protein Q8P68_02090 [Candidatus Peregrinibacteria bacterium]|nr:hypothetical protein [Candidatus Peregrinibacteria bacterium]MDZ4244551.1 hypothetical protein [Candidatus Gracilibacteria bacterium]